VSIHDLIAIAIVCAGAGFWTLRLSVLFRGSRSDAVAADASDVSIIVPARNEAHNLPPLLESLRRLDPAPGEIIVVDDHSTDATASIARAGGARVVTPPPLPDGWLGKPWACHTGAQAATGRYLLFTDADTVHAPDSLGRALARMRQTDAGLLSVVPTHIVRALWERLQGVFQLLLLIACKAGGTGGGERRFSIGQYLLFRRDAYDDIGRHPAVKHRVAEDLAFARMIEDRGHRFELLEARGLMKVRMYPEGLGGFVRGWRRNFREGMAAAGVAGVVEISLIIGWLLGLPLLLVGAALAGDAIGLAVWAGLYVVTAAEIARRQRRLGDLPVWSAPLYPLFAGLFIVISALAVVDRLRRAPVQWKSRSVKIAAGMGSHVD
jgi:glycosyltransferase involved in cell wall biosynthesis